MSPTVTSKDASCTGERLLKSALQLFAERGFANTSIRELAKKAEVNVSAVSYYFTDKAGLYRAAYNDNLLSSGLFERMVTNPTPLSEQTLRQVLSDLIKSFVEPLKHGDVAAWRIRLHMREMLEPSGLWEDEIHKEILPAQKALQQRLCQELGLAQPDDRILRLALSIAGLGVHLLVSRDVVQGVAPQLLANEKAIDDYTDQLLEYALAMVECERRRLETRPHL